MTLQATYPQIQLTLLAPAELGALIPMELVDNSSGLHAAVMERSGLENLPVHWGTACGFYILFSALSEDNAFEAYVGKANSGFHRRLASHHETKDYWRNAILISRTGNAGFSTAQIAWLESRIREVLGLSANVNVRNIPQSEESFLPDAEERDMELVILSVLRVMFLRGYRNPEMNDFADDLTSRITHYESKEPLAEVASPPVQVPTPAMPVTPPVTVIPLSATIHATDEDKFLALKEWRNELSRTLSISPFIIFHDKALREIARIAPTTVEELASIPGVGKDKTALYGSRLVTLFAPVQKPYSPITE